MLFDLCMAFDLVEALLNIFALSKHVIRPDIILKMEDLCQSQAQSILEK